jgi:hypothetical protein
MKNPKTESYFFNVAVAAIDLPGLKRLTRKDDKCRSAMKALIGHML